MINIMDVGATYGYPCAGIFEPWKPNVAKWDLSKGMEQLRGINLVIFGGGQDVSPAMYNHRNIASGTSNFPTARDSLESRIYDVVMGDYEGIYCLGICRGAQFLCAVSGGWLVQHLDNHAGQDHVVILTDDMFDAKITTNSYHHQMMVPSNGRGTKLLGYTKQLSNEMVYDVNAIGVKGEVPDYNPEIVLFNSRSLGFQCHPEYLPSNHKLPTKVREYVYHYFGLGENPRNV